jgi:catechol 2,3-dioxygenase-like lactoylglutathione lyase family enzyme
MPDFTGISHVGLSVTDIDRSSAWYADVLGFQVLMPTDAPGFRRVLMAHPATGMFLGLSQHDATSGGAFDEATPGLDHLAFAVASRDELAEWEARLAEHGVSYSAIQDTFYGSVLVFRDPDNIQLELFVQAPRPE